MATLNAKTANDMTTWDLTDLRDGSGVTNTPTDWVVDGLGGGNIYTFTGTGLSYSGGGNPLPDGGTLDTFAMTESGTLSLTINGSIDGAVFSSFLPTNDVTGLQAEWFKGADLFKGSTGDDHLLSYNGNDVFDLDKGGQDWVEGGKGDDTFDVGTTLSAGDKFDGGKGFDTLSIDGDIFFDFGPVSLASVETVLLTGGFYQLTFQDANFGRGGITVDGTALLPGDGMIIVMAFGSTEGITAIGGRGADTFLGANGADTFDGGRGEDYLNGGRSGDNLTGGNNNDRFVYQEAKASTGPSYDTITDFNSAAADLIALTFAINDVNPELTSGALSTASFNADMEAAITSALLGKLDAMLFTPDAGTLAGNTFLIIDVNDKKGYQANKDLVILMSDTSGLGDFGSEDFTTIG